MRRNEKGFGAVQFLMVLGVVLLIGAIGYYVWRAHDRKTEKTAINSYADCVAAGKPVMQSYPSQCAANGKTYTNPDQKAPAAPEQEQTKSDTAKVDTEDKAAIIKSIETFCSANGATELTDVDATLNSNMQDPNLFIKSSGFASIAATCGDSGFRGYLQKTSDSVNTWKLIARTQMGAPECSAVDGTGIPSVIASSCYDENGESRPIK